MLCGVGQVIERWRERRQVVLVDEALPLPHTGVAERREAGVVGDGLQRQRAVHLEPLRALPPPRPDSDRVLWILVTWLGM